MRVYFINRFFYPDHAATSQMLADLAFSLAARGHDIAVVTSRLDYENPVMRFPKRETIRGVDVIRIATSGFGRSRMLGRSFDYLTFYLSVIWTLWRHVRAGDLVIGMTDPPLLSVVVTPVCWIRRARAGNWLQDIFPEVATVLGMGQRPLRRLLFSLLRWARNATVRRSVLNVAIGERMAEHVRSFGVAPERVAVIPNWADGQQVVPIDNRLNRLRREWQLDGVFVVGYSGNLGRAHDYETILQAIVLTQQREAQAPAVPVASGSTVKLMAETAYCGRTPIHWLFIGGGALMKRFRDEVEGRGLFNVHFQPYQARERLSESLSVPDVHLISLRPELEGYIVPSKYYGIAAAGRTAVYIGAVDGEIGHVLTNTETGFAVPEGRGDDLARTVEMLALNPETVAETGRRARKLFDSRYDLRIAVSVWETAILRAGGAQKAS
jgi:glycosyltransferase involved in cell wall biosynthesis